MRWEKVALGEVCRIEKGNIGIKKAVDGQYPLVVTGEERKSHNEFQFNDEAVVIPLVSSTGHGHKSLKRIHYQEGKFAVGTILCAVIPKDKEILNAKFLYLFLSLNKEKELVSRMKGMANVTLPMKSIAEISIPLPPLEDQLSLIHRFDSIQQDVDGSIEEQSHQLTLLKKLRQQILQDAVMGRLVEQDPDDEPASVLLEKIAEQKQKLIAEGKIKKGKPLPEITEMDELFDIPANWVWCRLGEITMEQSYGTSRKTTDNGEVPVLRMGNITSEGYIKYSNLKYTSASNPDLPKLYLKTGNILFNRTNSFELVGKTAVFDREESYTCASYLITVRTASSINSYYISNYINSIICRLTQIEPETIQQNGQANFNGTKLSKILIPIPPLNEQHRIVTKVKQLMKICDELEQSIQENQKHTQELLQVALIEALEPSNSEKNL